MSSQNSASALERIKFFISKYKKSIYIGIGVVSVAIVSGVILNNISKSSTPTSTDNNNNNITSSSNTNITTTSTNAGAPSAVTNLMKISATNSTLVMNFTKSSNADSYKASVKLSSSSSNFPSPAAINVQLQNDGVTMQFTLTGLLTYTQYDVEVIAVNSIGESQPTISTNIYTWFY